MYYEHGFLCHCLVFTLSKHLLLAFLFLWSTLGATYSISQLKCFPPSSLALSMAIITMAPNSLIMITPNINPLPFFPIHSPSHAHAALRWSFVSSPQPPHQPIREWCMESRLNTAGSAVFSVSMGGIDGILLGRPGTARLPIKLNHLSVALCLKRKCSCEEAVTPWSVQTFLRVSSGSGSATVVTSLEIIITSLQHVVSSPLHTKKVWNCCTCFPFHPKKQMLNGSFLTLPFYFWFLF